MKNKRQHTKCEKGSTLVEALIATAILSFVIVSILGAVAQQQMTTRRTSDKNTAVFLAESRLEELLKLPANQLQEETYVDYAVPKPKSVSDGSYEFDMVYVPQGEAIPTSSRHFRRTTDIQIDDLGEMADIMVMVEYGDMQDIAFSSDLSEMKKRRNVVVLTARRTTQ